MRCLGAAGCLLLVVLAACGGADPGRQAPSSVSPPPSSPAPEPSSVAMAQRQRAKIAVSGNPDWLAADDTSLYVKTDSGTVAVVDPASNRVVRSFPTGAAGGLCQGLGVAFGSVWTCSPDPSGAGDEVLRLDPRSGKVLARLPVAKRPDQGHLEAAAGRLWVITDAGLVGIDPATNQPDPPLDLGVAGTELAVGEEMVWVSSVGDGAVVRVDPAARAVVARAAGLDSPRELTVGDHVWVLTRAGLVALDRDGLEHAGTVPTGPQSCGLATTPEAVWVSDTEPFLQQVDPATRTVLAEVTTDTGSCGDVRVAHGSIWATAADDDVLYRLDP